MNEQLLFVTPYQATVIYAALATWQSEMEAFLHADDLFDASDAEVNNTLTVINSTVEAAAIMKQIKHRFDIIENE